MGGILPAVETSAIPANALLSGHALRLGPEAHRSSAGTYLLDYSPLLTDPTLKCCLDPLLLPRLVSAVHRPSQVQRAG